MKEGVRYLISHKDAKFVVGIFFIFMSCIGSLYVVTVVFVQEATKSMTATLGIFAPFLFVGFALGSYIYGKIGHRFSRNKTIFLSFISSGIFVILFAVSLKLWGLLPAAFASLFILGAAVAPVATSGNTIIHETIDEKMRGRVFSSIGIIMNVGFMLFMFAGSILAEHIGRLLVIVNCGIILIAIGCLGYILNRRERFIRVS